jgi:predicted enzyme related to lactoylglutathione lyase
MAQPVVHFEVIGKDGPKLQAFYTELFGWKIDANNPMNYGTVAPEAGAPTEGGGIGGGVAGGPDGYEGHVTFYVRVPDVEASLAQAESLGGTRLMGPDDVMPGLTIGQFQDPEGHLIGVMSGAGSNG